MIHQDPHPLARHTVRLNAQAHDPAQKAVVPGAEFRIEDWWDRLLGKSWMVCDGNPAAIHYGMRSGLTELPIDNEVVYGKIGAFGHLVHVSELSEETTTDD